MGEAEVLIPRELWLRVQEVAKRLGREPEDLIAEAVKELYARLEARRPEDVIAELLGPAKDRIRVLRPLRGRGRHPEDPKGVVEIEPESIAIFRLPSGSYIAVPDHHEEAYWAKDLEALAEALDLKDLKLEEA